MKTAVITGASAGLGWEIVQNIQTVFPEIQCYWLIARRRERLDVLAEEIQGKKVVPICLDLEQASALETYRNLLQQNKPEVALLVNNAGCGYLGPFGQGDIDRQLRMTDLNVRAATAMTALTLPYMGRGSHIVQISSIASFVPTPRMTVYSATKAYLSFFSRGLQEELRPRGISVTAVCPGPMSTEFLDVGGIRGESKTFSVLPYCNPQKVALGALLAAKRGRAVYTPKLFYKFYRVLAGLLPQALMVKFSKT